MIRQSGNISEQEMNRKISPVLLPKRYLQSTTPVREVCMCESDGEQSVDRDDNNDMKIKISVPTLVIDPLTNSTTTIPGTSTIPTVRLRLKVLEQNQTNKVDDNTQMMPNQIKDRETRASKIQRSAHVNPKRTPDTAIHDNLMDKRNNRKDPYDPLCKRTVPLDRVTSLDDSPEVTKKDLFVNAAYDQHKKYSYASPINQLLCISRSPSGKRYYGEIKRYKDDILMIDLAVREAGIHGVDILENHQHIPGSPFNVNIAQISDINKIKIFGPGLLSGIIDNFRDSFQIDTKGAGPGDLKLAVYGPRKTFYVEMTASRENKRVVNVKYYPTVSGIYVINIFWNGIHISGSPHELFIAKDKVEMKRWIHNPDEIKKRESVLSAWIV